MKWSIVALTACLFSFASAQHVRFVVTGDGRWQSATRPGDENGVNVGAMTRLVASILKEKPDAFLFNGDLVGGAKTDAAELSQFETWFKVMDPIYDAGIKVLTARGNHEMGCENPNDVWRKVMTGKHANPMDGPAGEEGMTYAFPFKNCLFISLDEFATKKLSINQDWLDKTLKAPHPPHIFTFAHKMAFFSGSHDDGMWTDTPKRDTFIASLVNAGARTVFFGHDHLYDHLTAKLPDWADGKELHQFVIGTAGAPFYHKKPWPQDGQWVIDHKAHDEDKIGYAVIDVDDMKVTIRYKSEKSPGVFDVVDTFEYILGK